MDFSISFSSHPGGSDTVASCTDRSSPSKDHQMDDGAANLHRWSDLKKGEYYPVLFQLKGPCFNSEHMGQGLIEFKKIKLNHTVENS